MNMDIKTKIEDFFINIALGPVLAKRERVFGNREKEMNRCIKAFFSAIKGSDTDRIKALFAQLLIVFLVLKYRVANLISRYRS